MKLNLLFLVSLVVIFVNAAEDAATDDKTTEHKDATHKETTTSSTAASGGSGDSALDKTADKTKKETLTLKGSFNGTDTTDQGFNYNYKHGGSDWSSLTSKYGVENNCGNDGSQSPINLLQPIWSYGWAYGDTIPKQNDAHETTYNNLRKGV